MNATNDEDTILRTLSVPKPIEEAFAVFTQDIGEWWPADYTWAQDVLQDMVIEPGVDGRCFERGPHGFEVDWGRVLVWEPPHRLVFTWQISADRQPVPDPNKASEIEVRFEAEGATMTRIDFEHRHFSRHREDADEYQAMLEAPEGWPYILNCYVRDLNAN